MAKVNLSSSGTEPKRPLYYTNVYQKGSVYIFCAEDDQLIDLTSGETSRIDLADFIPLNPGQVVTIEV